MYTHQSQIVLSTLHTKSFTNIARLCYLPVNSMKKQSLRSFT